jgi:putative membrane protein
VAFTGFTWLVAFAAEASSIRTGIPFGWYYYLPTTNDRELWIAGVPFFDSISFPFLLVASYGLAWLLLARRPDHDSRRESGLWPRPRRLPHLALATGLFVLADVIIDPVALRGDRWFLGQIYGYPDPGVYFGIPLANFLGWAVVGAVAIALYHAWECRLPAVTGALFQGRARLCPGLYFVVLVFNLSVTFALREWWLGLCGVLLALPVAIATLRACRFSRVAWATPRGEGAAS